jgi:hypothetical protein
MSPRDALTVGSRITSMTFSHSSADATSTAWLYCSPNTVLSWYLVQGRRLSLQRSRLKVGVRVYRLGFSVACSSQCCMIIAVLHVHRSVACSSLAVQRCIFIVCFPLSHVHPLLFTVPYSSCRISRFGCRTTASPRTACGATRSTSPPRRWNLAPQASRHWSRRRRCSRPRW